MSIQSRCPTSSVLRMQVVQVNCRSAFSSTVFVFRVTEARRSELNWRYDWRVAFYTPDARRMRWRGTTDRLTLDDVRAVHGVDPVFVPCLIVSCYSLPLWLRRRLGERDRTVRVGAASVVAPANVFFGRPRLRSGIVGVGSGAASGLRKGRSADAWYKPRGLSGEAGSEITKELGP